MNTENGSSAAPVEPVVRRPFWEVVMGLPEIKDILHTADGITDKPMHTLDRDGIMERIAEVLRQHRCRDWHYEDEGGSMQLLDVLAQNANDGTVSSALEKIDDLAADIVDAIFGG